jgi:DNA-binding transcriptional LysR family regulator
MRLNDIFIAGEKLEELSLSVLSLEDLKKYPLITMDKNTVAYRSLNTFFSSLGIDLQPAIEVGSWDLMKRLVSKGMGIGVIPKEYAQRELQSGELFEVRTDPVLPVRSVGMLLPKNQPVSYALHSFIEYFRNKKV